MHDRLLGNVYDLHDLLIIHLFVTTVEILFNCGISLNVKNKSKCLCQNVDREWSSSKCEIFTISMSTNETFITEIQNFAYIILKYTEDNDIQDILILPFKSFTVLACGHISRGLCLENFILREEIYSLRVLSVLYLLRSLKRSPHLHRKTIT